MESSLLKLKDFLENDILKSIKSKISLSSKKRDYNLFNIFSISLKEDLFSLILTFLFDSEQQHKLNLSFLRYFLKEFSDHKIVIDVLEMMQNPDEIFTSVIPQKNIENGRFDIFVNLLSPSGNIKAILVIENKMPKGKEQEGQIKKYQDYLIKNYPGILKMIFYVTLSGEKSKGVEHNLQECPVIPTSYGNIINALYELSGETSGNMRDFIKDLIQMYQEYIGENKEMKIIREDIDKLWVVKNYRELISAFSGYQPNIRIIWPKIKTEVIQKLDILKDEDFVIDTWPKEEREENFLQLKFEPKKFNKTIEKIGLRLIFLFEIDKTEPDVEKWVFKPSIYCHKMQKKYNLNNEQYWAMQKEIIQKLGFKHQRSMINRHWIKLIQGRPYKMDDYSENDKNNIVRLITESILENYPIFTKKIIDAEKAISQNIFRYENVSMKSDADNGLLS